MTGVQTCALPISRVEMADTLKRGLPKILVVSGGIASLLITNKMIRDRKSVV